MKVRLTQAIVNSLEPDSKPYAVRDAVQPGLCVIVSPGGTKAISVEVRRAGKLIKRKLGTWPELSLTSARERTAQLLGTAAETRGMVPVTFRQLFKKRLDAVKSRKKTWREDERKYKQDLAQWGSRQVATFTPAEIERWRDGIAQQRGEVTANRTLSLVKSVFAYGCKKGYLVTDPARLVDKYPEKPRERFLTADELPRFLKSIQLEPDDYRDIFSLLLFVGARKFNVLSMRWCELDLDNGIWIVPADKSKNGRQLFLPLVGPAMEILDIRKERFGDVSEWVFPAPHNRTGHVTEIRKPWLRAIKRAGLSDLHIHDLRHSLASWQAMNGASLAIIGKSLGHSDHKSTARYAHLAMDPVRKSVASAVASMQAAGKGGVR